MINANTIFNANQVDEMKQLLKVKEEIKALEAKKDALSKSIKDNMIKAKIDECNVDGCEFKLSISERKTVTKATKDEFVASLVGQGKSYLVITSIEPDLDSIFAEVDAGTLNKEFVKKYVKVTEVKTLRTE